MMNSKMGGMCFNWKVLAGLGVLGLGVFIVAPSLAWTALPLLLLAACPISMLFMMRGMQGGQCSHQPAPETQPRGAESRRDEQLAELEAQLARVHAQYGAISSKIAELEAARVATERQVTATAAGAELRAQEASPR